MLVFEVKKSDKEILSELVELEDYVTIVEPSNLDGEAIMQFLIEINKITAPLVSSIIILYINSNKIKIKKNGVNITMILSKKNLNKIDLITELLNMENDKEVKTENEFDN